MEFNQFFPYVNQYLPDFWKENDDFIDYLSTPNIMETYASHIMMVLPGDRLSYYKTSDINVMR